MRGDGLRAWARLLLAGAVAFALAGCSDVDEALFGPYPNNSTGAPQADNGSAEAPDAAQNGQAAQAAPPSDQSAEATPAPPPAAPPAAEASSGSTAEAAPAAQPEAVVPPPAPAVAEAQPTPGEEPMPSAAPPSAAEGESLPGTLPPTAGGETVALAGSGDFAPPAVASAIAPIRIEPGPNTGTAVGQTVSGLRGEISGLNNKLLDSARHLQSLREASARATTEYQNVRAKIMAHLQIGTTRANPELISAWNTAQNALDQLATNLNAMGALGVEVGNDSTSMQQALQQVTAAYNLAGAVDEDHRQLNVLEDETRQMIVSYDRLKKDVLADVPRQTSFIANERTNLAQLAAAIKRGELYNSSDRRPAGLLHLASAD